MHVYLLDGVHWSDLRSLQRWLHHLPDMHRVHYGHTLQQPRGVCVIERWQYRMHVYLLDGVHWSDLRRLQRWLHHLPDMHSVHYGHTLQQPRGVCDIERWQYRMHVYLLDGVQWDDMQRLRRRLSFVPHLHTSRRGTTLTAVASVVLLHRRETAHYSTRWRWMYGTHMHWWVSVVRLP